jgi:cytochrome c-type biogenesis protein CcmF
MYRSDVGNVGGALVSTGFGAAAVAALLGVSAVRTGRFARGAAVASWMAAASLSVALAILARAFAVGDHSFVAVADHSREALGTYDRVMGLWGGMAGSLLLFTTMTAVFAAVGLGRRPSSGAVAVTGVVIATLAAITQWLADPFARLEIPALDGVGLTPILEHWAMRVHPPMVYAGLTVLIVPAALALGLPAVGEERLRWSRIQPWLVCSWALLGLGMVLGAHWAYAELGWGGYWAWDPVENAALLPWLAVTVALHVGRRGESGWGRAAVVLPFLLAMLGSTLTRSGATSSVHAFAEARSIGRALTLLTVAAAIATVVAIRRASRPAAGAGAPTRGRLAACVVLGAGLAVVLVGTLYPVLRGWFGGDRLAIAPGFFNGALVPIVLVGLAVQVSRGRVPSLRVAAAAVAAGVGLWALGWREPAAVALGAAATVALVASVRTLVRGRRAAELAHAGAALLLLGVAGTATGEQVTVPIAVGEVVDLAGHEVLLEGIRTEAGPTSASTAVVADVRIDGHARTPALVAHPDRGVLLAESTLRSTPAVDVQVILRDASDDRAIVTVTVSPLQQLVWWGGLVTVLGGLLSVRVSRRRAGPAWRRGATRGSSGVVPAPAQGSSQVAVPAGPMRAGWWPVERRRPSDLPDGASIDPAGRAAPPAAGG